jgi:cysteinyl-tRNA synthetase
MSLRVYNTLSRSKEAFEPLNPPRVGMYVCGPTVYDHAHIGHARANVVFDVMVRYLRWLGYAVTYVRNFTDVDDKIIARAAERGVDPAALAEEFIASFTEDMTALGLLTPDVEPRCTEHMADIIALVQKLVDREAAYATGGDVYFAVKKFPTYGSLSHRDIDQLQAGARIEVGEHKRDPLDFALWKAAKPGEPTWDSPWGPGRPGWHIECSAMSARHLGESFDIHGGGADLAFPHHENERAQSEAAFGKSFVKYWIHNGFVRVNQEKMSKSLQNFSTIKEILEKWPAEVLRLFLIGQHYRSPLDFSDAALDEARRGLIRLYRGRRNLDRAIDLGPKQGGEAPDDKLKTAVLEFTDHFSAAMNDDFNTAQALGLIFGLIRTLNSACELRTEPAGAELHGLLTMARERLAEAGAVLGLMQDDPSEFLRAMKDDLAGDLDAAAVESLIAARQAARKNKDWAGADAIREQLTAMGVVLEDTPGGTRWRPA